MAVPMENSLSLRYLTGTERETLSKNRQRSVKHSINKPLGLHTDSSTPDNHQYLRRMYLQQRLRDLKERECTAKQHNRQLLEQFEEAQDTLKDMLARNAAMKKIRVEYERYLQENYLQWQIKERKTQTAQRKTMEDHLSSYLKNTEWVTMSSERPTLSQGLTTRSQQLPTLQEHSNYNQSQSARLPISAPYQAHGSSQVPPSLLHASTFPHIHSFSSAPSHHRGWPTQDPAGWSSLRADHPWSWPAGVAGIPSGSESLWGQINMNEPPPEAGDSTIVGEEEEEEEETCRAPSSTRGRGGGSRSPLSHELDIKPVRLSSGSADSSESGRDCSETIREKRKKRGRPQHSSPDKTRRSSEEASSSSAIVIASDTVAQSCESDASSEKGHSNSNSRRMRRGGGLAAGPQKSEKVEKEKSSTRKDELKTSREGSQHAGEEPGSLSEKVGNQSPHKNSESCKEETESQEEESDSDSLKIEKGVADETKKQESNSSEESSTEEKEEENKKILGEEDEDSCLEKDHDEDEDDEEDSARNTPTEEEVETGAEDETDAEEDDEDQSDKLEDEGEKKQQVSESSQDEVEDESGEGSDDEEEDDDEGEEVREDEAGEPEDKDSDDSIISPQEKRPKQMQVILEEAAEDDDEEEEEEESKAGSPKKDSDEFSDEDIENILAPQEPRQNKKNDLKAEGKKPTEVCDKVQIFQVQQKAQKTDQQSDSDEFDHFYD